jgi:hypothetical protein
VAWSDRTLGLTLFVLALSFPALGRRHTQGATAVLEAASTARGPNEQLVDTAAFGMVTLADYLIFQAHHTRHHRPQSQANI